MGARLADVIREGKTRRRQALQRNSRHGGRWARFVLNRASSDTKKLHWRDWMQLYSVVSCSYIDRLQARTEEVRRPE
jgi:hypothetical protein